MGRGFDNVNLVFTVQPRDDNERNSCNGNQYISSSIYKELAQHSTVTFTKVLNVSYTVSSPISRSHNKVQRESAALPNSSERNTSDAGDSCESNQHSIQINNSNSIEYAGRQSSPQIPTIFKIQRDCVHWTKNCGAFLCFHR
jgi:hypothetical protein